MADEYSDRVVTRRGCAIADFASFRSYSETTVGRIESESGERRCGMAKREQS